MPFLHEKIILPASDLLTGQQVYKHLRWLLATQYWPKDKILQLQESRLLALLMHAKAHVPYYQAWFANHHTSAEKLANPNSLKELPIVDKKIMRQLGSSTFISCSSNSHQRIVCHSSGTTGEPFEYYVSKQAYSLNTAAKLRTWYQAGYRLGDRYMKLVSSPRDSLIKKMQDKINNCCCIGFEALDSIGLSSILQAIDRNRPSILRTHPNIAYLLAKERLNGHYQYSPRVIMTTSSDLTPAYREIIGQAFGCDIIDSYSCEGTANIAETPLHDGYHISREYGIIEILDSEGRSVENGIGRVVSTDLWNFDYPFIRYDTHDEVEVRDGIITRILGRKNETLQTIDGKLISGQVICDYFSYLIHGIEAYQIVNQKDGNLLIRIIPGKTFDRQDCKRIESCWTQKTGRVTSVVMVDSIPTTPNGKSLTIINE